MDLPYVFPVAEVVKVTDGDTYWLRLDVGFREQLLADIRLNGFDAPEIKGPTDAEKEAAQQAKALADDFLTGTDYPGALYVQTQPDPDDFGRWLGDVFREAADGTLTHLGDVLHAQGLASIWPTRWHEEYL